MIIKKWLIQTIILVTGLLFISTICVLFLSVFLKTDITFTEDAEALLYNRMQGLYLQMDSASTYRLLKAKHQDINLMLLTLDLDGYQQSDISEEKLAELNRALTQAVENKRQIIFRAAYGFSEFGTVEPEDFNLVLRHIHQISNVLYQYADIILCVQAGMIGPWGEWHSSSLLEGYPDEKQTRLRNQVVEAWIDSLPEQIVIQLRRPEFIRQAIATGLPINRMGFHDDALLSSYSDMGTYLGDETIREQELSWVNKNLSNGFSGGEVPKISSFTEIENVIKEFNQLHLTYLNSTYNVEVLEYWDSLEYKGQNALTYITQHLGNRLYVQSVSLPNAIFFGNPKLKTDITVKNTGFASPNPNLQYYLAVRQEENIEYVMIDQQNISITKDSIHLKINVRFPKNMDRNAPYHLGMWIGYSAPEKGFALSLANENFDEQDQITYFAVYQPGFLISKLAKM